MSIFTALDFALLQEDINNLDAEKLPPQLRSNRRGIDLNAVYKYMETANKHKCKDCGGTSVTSVLSCYSCIYKLYTAGTILNGDTKEIWVAEQVINYRREKAAPVPETLPPGVTREAVDKIKEIWEFTPCVKCGNANAFKQKNNNNIYTRMCLTCNHGASPYDLYPNMRRAEYEVTIDWQKSGRIKQEVVKQEVIKKETFLSQKAGKCDCCKQQITDFPAIPCSGWGYCRNCWDKKKLSLVYEGLTIAPEFRGPLSSYSGKGTLVKKNTPDDFWWGSNLDPDDV